MFKANVPRQLLVFVVASVGATVLAGVLSYFTVMSAGRSASMLATQGLESARGSYNLLEGFSNKRAGLQRLLRLTDADELEKGLADLETLDKEVGQLLAGSETTRERIRTESARLAVTEREVRDAVLRGDYGAANTAFITVAGGQYEAIEKAIREHTEAATAAAKARLAESVRANQRSMMWQLAVLAVVLVGLAAFGWILRRRIGSQLTELSAAMGETGEKLTAAARHVAASSGSLSENATSQAASLEETSASMEEMSSMTRRNAENAHDAAGIMNEIDAIAGASNTSLKALIASMAAIQDSSAKVSKINKTIDEIAFQTNILALNAAVEAARAGEAGMGFAVVADEVRTLAQRSATAAKDTASLIEEATSNATQGAAKMQEVVDRVSSITAGMAKAKGLVDQVSAASDQQAQGVSQVTQAITQMERTTQANAATAEETAAASEELNQQAQVTRALVDRLETMAGRTSAGDVEASPAAPAATQAARPSKKALPFVERRRSA